MNSLLSRPARSARRSRSTAAAPGSPALIWIHDGRHYRASVWPDVRFEREAAPGEWQEVECSEEALASAGVEIGAAAWRRYLEFVPPEVRSLLESFDYGRMAALQVAACCPVLVPELVQVPALTPFVARHASLRGEATSAWSEMAAVYEREGVFGLLQWLGLPASRQTLTILGHVSDPDLPRRLLEPLRAALWEPEAIWALSHAPVLTDERLTATCHALAA